MKPFLISLFVLTLFLNTSVAQDNTKLFYYLSPAPGSKSVHKESNIAFRTNKQNLKIVNQIPSIVVSGSIHGKYFGKLFLSTDNVTYLYKPETNFSLNEKIDVEISFGSAFESEKFSFDFEVTGEQSTEFNHPTDVCLPNSSNNEINSQVKESYFQKSRKPNVSNSSVAIPSDFPAMNIQNYAPTDSGYVFTNNWGGVPYLIIMQNDGTPVYFKKMLTYARDFKVQTKNILSYRIGDNVSAFFTMDSTYTPLDTFRVLHGYGTDEHEFQMLPNGHVLMIGLDYRTVNMSLLVPNGKTNATVIGNTVIELDESKNIVFEWKSWDHFNILDCIGIDLTQNTIDYIHMNAISMDTDGNIIISSRHLSEITKINRQTGAIMWRLSGKNNQFTFINDTYKLSWQHDARAIGNNRYTAFDNGQFHSPQFSRGVEYLIDTTAKTATLVWQYRNNPDIFSTFMGNNQRLPNGNSFICWGDASNPKGIEVSSTGQKLWQMNFVSAAHSYRSFRFKWTGVAKTPYLNAEPYLDKVKLYLNKFGDNKVSKYYIYGGVNSLPTTLIDSSVSNTIDITNIPNHVNYYFRVRALDSLNHLSGYSNQESVFTNFTIPGSNMVINGDFSQGLSNWQFYFSNSGAATTIITSTGELYLQITNGGTQIYSVQVYQSDLPIVKGKTYIFEFDAWASASRTFEPKVQKNSDPWTNYSKTSTTQLTTTKKHFSFTFTMTDNTDLKARILFECGTNDADIFLDNISLKEKVSSSIEEQISKETGYFKIMDPYPNPFNSLANIPLNIPSAGELAFTIFDLLGVKIKSFSQSYQSPGSYLLKFNGDNLPSGIYVFTAEFSPATINHQSKEKNSQHGKLLLLR